jgi:hypothetical protein
MRPPMFPYPPFSIEALLDLAAEPAGLPGRLVALLEYMGFPEAHAWTTAIDGEGLIRPTTVIAHSSGECVSSDWPVCSCSDGRCPT